MFNENSFADNILSSVIQDVKQDETCTILDKYGLNWKVSKEPLLLLDGSPTPYFGIVREDNRTCFSTCKDSYMPFQNSELFELVTRISEKIGYEIHGGGVFNGGGKIYLQLATGEVKDIGLNHDTLKKFATAINSHDGTTSLRWGHTNVTISCRNTFNAAYRDLCNSARHTDSIHMRVEQSLKQLQGIEEAEKSIFETYFRLAETPVKRDNINKVAGLVLDISPNDLALSQRELQDKYSTYSVNRLNELLHAISKEMGQKGETLWGLFSGVTNYTTHTIPAPSRTNGRLESKYVGTGYKLDNEVFAELQTMLS